MKLVFGNNDHLAMAKRGEIPKEIENKKAKILREYGCEDACEHCEMDDSDWYYCSNCNNGGISHKHMAFKWEGKVRCNGCKYILTREEDDE